MEESIARLNEAIPSISLAEEEMAKFSETCVKAITNPAAKYTCELAVDQLTSNKSVLELIQEITLHVQDLLDQSQSSFAKASDDMYTRLSDAHWIYVSEYQLLERHLAREQDNLNRAETDAQALLHAEKCHEVLHRITEAHHQFQEKSSGILSSLKDQIRHLSTEFRDKFLLFFDADLISEKGSKDKEKQGTNLTAEDARKRGTTLSVGKHQFLLTKVDDHLAYLQKKLQEIKAPAIESEQIDTAAHSHAKKEIAKIEWNPKPKARQKEESMEPGNLAPVVQRKQLKPIFKLLHIPKSYLKIFRENLFTQSMTAVDEMLLSSLERATVTIDSRIAELERQLNTALFHRDAKMNELEQQYKDLLETIANNSLMAEREAMIRSFNISQISKLYESAVSELEQTSAHFQKQYGPALIRRIKDAKNTDELKRIEFEFHDHLTSTTSAMKKKLSSSMERSRNLWQELVGDTKQSQKPAIKEKSVDEILASHQETIERVQRETEETAARLESEVIAHKEELDLIDRTSARVKAAKVRVRVVCAHADNLKQQLRTSLDEFIAKISGHQSLLDDFAEAAHLQEQIKSFAAYMLLNQTGGKKAGTQTMNSAVGSLSSAESEQTPRTFLGIINAIQQETLQQMNSDIKQFYEERNPQGLQRLPRSPEVFSESLIPSLDTVVKYAELYQKNANEEFKRTVIEFGRRACNSLLRLADVALSKTKKGLSFMLRKGNSIFQSQLEILVQDKVRCKKALELLTSKSSAEVINDANRDAHETNDRGKALIERYEGTISKSTQRYSSALQDVLQAVKN
ncbi:hypothetical protein BJ742DRAFT_842223, partial [Cladochytrium replicatum]